MPRLCHINFNYVWLKHSSVQAIVRSAQFCCHPIAVTVLCPLYKQTAVGLISMLQHHQLLPATSRMHLAADFTNIKVVFNQARKPHFLFKHSTIELRLHIHRQHSNQPQPAACPSQCSEHYRMLHFILCSARCWPPKWFHTLRLFITKQISKPEAAWPVHSKLSQESSTSFADGLHSALYPGEQRETVREVLRSDRRSELESAWDNGKCRTICKRELTNWLSGE